MNWSSWKLRKTAFMAARAFRIAPQSGIEDGKTRAGRARPTKDLLNFPGAVLILTFVALWLSELAGTSFRKRWHPEEDQREDFRLIGSATLTLLGLIIDTTFSMAIIRYDQRKNYEEAEANAIGTEYFEPGFASFRGRSEGAHFADELSGSARSFLRNFGSRRASKNRCRNRSTAG